MSCQLPSNAGADETLCDTDNTTLAANTPTVGTGLWTVVSGTATFADATNPTTTVTGLSTGANVLRWTISNGSCAPSTSDVTITVSELPTPSDAGADQELCDTDNTTLAANTPTVGTGLWTVISGTAVFADATNPTTTVSGLSTGANVLRWTISNGSCAPSTSDVTITVSELPTTSNAGADQELCDTDNTALAANTPTVGTGLWTIVSGTATFADATNPTTTVTGLSTGANVLRWTISNGSCAPSEDQVTITVSELPTPSNAGADQELCDTDNTTLAANTPTVGTGLWTVISGTAVFADATNPTTTVSGLSVGTNVLRWTISNGSCAPSTSDVTITVSELPTPSDAGADQELCDTDNTTLAANTPTVGIGLWTVVSGTATFADATNPTTTVTGLSTGANVLRWTISNGSCAPSTSDVTITVSELPTPSDAGADQELCDTDNTALAANTPTVGTGLWTVISGTAVFADATNPTTTVTGLSTGTNVLRWTISNGSCAPSEDQVTITVSELPTTSNAGADQELCDTDNTTLAANTPTVGTGLWTVVSGTATFADATNPTTTVTGLSTGTNVLRWTISNGSCAPSEDQVTITVSELPTPSDAGADQALCDTDNTILAGNTPTVGTGLWTVISGTAVFADATNPTTAVSGLSVGTNVLRWTISNGSCAPSEDQVTITVSELPTPSNAGADQELCDTDNTTLAANTPTVGTGLWTVISGTAVFADATNPTTTVTGLSTGTNVLRWTISNGSCAPSEDQVTITVSELPTTSNAGADQELCDTDNTTLAANTPTVGTGLWTVVSGTATFADATNPTTAVGGLSVGTNVLRWTISNGSCPSSEDEVTITVSELPTPSDAGADQELCDTDNTTLSANTPTVGTGLWTVVSGTAVFADATNPTTAVSGLSVGTNVLRWTISNGSCAPSEDEVTITVSELPTPFKCRSRRDTL